MNSRKQKTTKQQSNAKKNVKRRRRRALTKAKISNLSRPQVHLSRCLISYAKAVVNPFGNITDFPCYPDNINLPSHKIQTKVRGTFQTGTTGVGWVVYDPWAPIYNDGAFSGTFSSFPILCTQSTFTGNAYVWAVAGGIPTPGVVGNNSNSPFSGNQFLVAANNWQYRLVTGGLSVRYIGTDFRNQGRVILYRDQHSDDIPHAAVNNYLGATLLTDNYAQAVPVTRKTKYITSPISENDVLSYQPVTFYSELSGGVARRCMLVLIDGGDTTTPQSWEFEAISYFEMTGRNLDLTSSDGDAAGLSAMHSVLPKRNPSTSPAMQENNLLNKIGDALVKGTSYIAPYAISAGTRFLKSQLGIPSFPSLPMLPSSVTVDEIDE